MRRRRSLASGLAGLALVAIPALTSAQSLADYDYEHLGFRGIGADLGWVWPNSLRSSEQIGLRLDLGYLGPGIRIIPSIGYWSSRFNDAEIDSLATRLGDQLGIAISGDDLGPVEWSDLSLSIDAQLVWHTPVNVLTFLGVGLGFHGLNGKGPAIEDTFVEDLLDSVAASVAGSGGLEMMVGDQLRAYVEGRYTFMIGVRYPSFRVGVQYMFGSDDTLDAPEPEPAGQPGGQAP